MLGLAIFHEASEVLTGDLPTPIKYHNTDIKNAYKNLEKLANDRLLDMLPDELREDYSEIFKPDISSAEYRIVKAADKLSAYLKCIEELRSGNSEFKRAKAIIEDELKKIDMPEVKYFMDKFIPSFKKSLDEMEK